MCRSLAATASWRSVHPSASRRSISQPRARQCRRSEAARAPLVIGHRDRPAQGRQPHERNLERAGLERLRRHQAGRRAPNARTLSRGPIGFRAARQLDQAKRARIIVMRWPPRLDSGAVVVCDNTSAVQRTCIAIISTMSVHRRTDFGRRRCRIAAAWALGSRC